MHRTDDYRSIEARGGGIVRGNGAVRRGEVAARPDGGIFLLGNGPVSFGKGQCDCSAGRVRLSAAAMRYAEGWIGAGKGLFGPAEVTVELGDGT